RRRAGSGRGRGGRGLLWLRGPRRRVVQALEWAVLLAALRAALGLGPSDRGPPPSRGLRLLCPQAGNDLVEPGVDVAGVFGALLRPGTLGRHGEPAPAAATRSTNRSVSSISSSASWSSVATCADSSSQRVVTSSLPTCCRKSSAERGGTTRSWRPRISSTGWCTSGSCSTTRGHCSTKEWKAFSGVHR